MLTPLETFLLIQDTIPQINDGGVVLMNNFYHNFPDLYPFLLENGIRDVQFARGINSKLELILYNASLSNDAISCGSNVIPPNSTFDFFSKNLNSCTLDHFQIKTKLSPKRTFSTSNLLSLVHNYDITIFNNNYLVLDNSFQSDDLKDELSVRLDNDNLLNRLVDRKKIILVKENKINLNNINKITYLIKNKKLILI